LLKILAGFSRQAFKASINELCDSNSSKVPRASFEDELDSIYGDYSIKALAGGFIISTRTGLSLTGEGSFSFCSFCSSGSGSSE